MRGCVSRPKSTWPSFEAPDSALVERKFGDLQARIEKLERRIEEMNEAFARGQLPPVPVKLL